MADREDEEWVAVQKKGFSRWANSYLRKRRLEVRVRITSTKPALLPN
jgi:hypothetical protein